MSFVIDKSNETFLGWEFRRRRVEGVWGWWAFRCTTLGRTVEMREVVPQRPEPFTEGFADYLRTLARGDPMHFPSKEAAVQFCQWRAKQLHVEYAEYRRQREPPAVPPTPAESAMRKILSLDHFSKHFEKDGRLREAADETMRSAEACIDAIATNPKQRDHLLVCARARRTHALALVVRWMRAFDRRPELTPRLQVVRS